MQICLEVYLNFRGRRIWKGTEEVPDGTTPAQLLRLLGLDDQPELAVIVNGRHHDDHAPLAPGDEVAILRRADGGQA